LNIKVLEEADKEIKRVKIEIRKKDKQIKDLVEKNKSNLQLVKRLFKITAILTDSTEEAYNMTDRETLSLIMKVINHKTGD